MVTYINIIIIIIIIIIIAAKQNQNTFKTEVYVEI